MVATDGAFWLQHVDLQHSVEASSSARLKHQVNMSSASENGPDAVNRLSSSIVALRTGCSYARRFINAGGLHQSGRKAGPPAANRATQLNGRWRLNNGPGGEVRSTSDVHVVEKKTCAPCWRSALDSVAVQMRLCSGAPLAGTRRRRWCQ